MLELYAGCGGISAACVAQGLRIAVPCEVERGAHFNLLDRRVQQEVLRWLRAGLVWMVWLGTPCTACSAARSGAKPPASKQCVAFTVRVLEECRLLGLHVALESPTTSRLFTVPALRRSLAKFGERGAFIKFHMCGFGAA